MDDYKIGFDMHAFADEIKNRALNNIIAVTLREDDESRKAMMRLVLTANKYGVSTETLLKILAESQGGENK